MPKNVDDLVLQDGIEIPDDPLAIEALLEEEEAGKHAETDEGTKGAKPADEGKPGDDKAQQQSDDDKSKQQQAADQSKGKPEEHETPAGPPQAVLRRERENRHKAEELLGEREQELDAAKAKIADLEATLAKGQDKLQAHADRLTGDPSIKLESLDKTKLEALRADLDDDVVDFLGRLVDQHNAIVEETSRLKAENAELIGERQREHAATQQDDIDTVPLLAVIQATRSKDADALWDRAVAYEKALQSDPDWADKSRGEVYAEVGRRLEAYLGDDAAKWLADTEQQPDKGGDKGKGKGSDRGKTVEDKLASARARATPDSLSDLPTGTAASQHEIERLEAMSIHDAEDLINKAIDKGNLDEVLQRLSSAR